MSQDKIFILLKDYLQTNQVTNYGIHLSKEMRAKAVLLAIEKIGSTVPSFTSERPNLSYPKYQSTQSFKNKIFRYLQKHQLELQQVWKEVYCAVAVGFFDSRIISLTEKKDPFLLLIEGQNEHTTFHEWFGNYETRIAEKADCPVLVVQPNTKWKPVEKILYIMDLDDAKVDNMRVLTSLTEKLDAHLQVVFISEKNINEADGNYQQMVNVFKNVLDFNAPTYHRIFGEKRGDEIIGLVKAISPDWFAFEQKNKNFFQRLYDDYNTKHLILQSDIPVLVF